MQTVKDFLRFPGSYHTLFEPEILLHILPHPLIQAVEQCFINRYRSLDPAEITTVQTKINRYLFPVFLWDFLLNGL